MNETEAATLVEIFHFYLGEGHNLTNLAKHLMKQGVMTPNGQRRWSVMSLRGMLTNPVYTGKVYAGRGRNVPTRQRNSPLKPIGRRSSNQPTNPEDWILVGEVPALVSKEDFDLVACAGYLGRPTLRKANFALGYSLIAMV